MTTIVVHGTMTIRGAAHYSWWWDSWREGGFLHSLSDGMILESDWHDVWHVNGRYVSEIPELNQEWSMWKGRIGQVSQHQGHFLWSGADMGAARDAGVTALVKYLNLIAQLTNESIRIVAHSHGCNLVKNASAHRKLSSKVFIDSAVFLACPHFFSKSAKGYSFTYRLAPERFGKILNLYSLSDTVQVGFAEAITGPPGARFADYLPPESSRIDVDPDTKDIYEDYEIVTAATKQKAHTVMHGSAIGGLSGMWLNGNSSFAEILGSLQSPLPAIPKDDDGA